MNNNSDQFDKSDKDNKQDINADLPKIFSSLQLEDLEGFNKKHLQQEDFQVIDKDDFSVQTNKNSSYSDDYSANKKMTTSIIRNSVVIEKQKDTKTNKAGSVWSSFANKISNIKNNLKYNLITTNSYVNFDKVKYVRLFDRIFTDEDIKCGVLSSYLETVFQFTYRSEFSPIIYENRIYTSDCGWGCMIRAAQMMMSKCVFENKVFMLGKDIDISENTLNRLRFETLVLFLDNNLKIEEIMENKDFDFILKHLPLILSEEEKLLKMQEENVTEEECKNDNSENLNSTDKDRIMTNFEFMMSEHKNEVKDRLFHVTELSPPFSIQNICKLSMNYEKGPGIWFSDVIMSSIFCEINNQFKAIANLELIHFNDGIIDEEVIFTQCFEELKCRDDCQNKTNYFKYSAKENDINDFDQFEELYNNKNSSANQDFNKLCPKCEEYYNNNSAYSEICKKENKSYIFKKGAVLFTSVRLGLDNIPNEYFGSITQIFKMPFNLGIIGGKWNSALYFIGEHSDKLIYLDPHVNQKSVKDSKNLLIESEFYTYSPKYFYEINIANISPAFTTAFYFRTLSEYELIVKYFENHSSLSHPVFKFRQIYKEAYSKQNSVKRLKMLEEINEEDDFCYVEYEEDYGI